MAEDDESLTEKHPVAAGVTALLGVALVVGLIFGGGALVATRALGVGGGEDIGEGGSASQTLFLPDVTDTGETDEPYLTLPTSDEPTTPIPSEPTSEPTSEAPEEKISLTALQAAVGVMEQIDLTGTYPGGDGAILQVQQFSEGSWDDFPAVISVSGETFSTYIQAGRVGQNRFRVVDTDTDETSNEVRVQIG